MNVKSLKSQLFAAVVMMLVACVALGSSTYAWFAINTTVTATGMTVKAETSSNLLIYNGDTASKTDKPKNLPYGTTAVLDQPSVALYPVSTADGETFFYTDTASVGGVGEATSQYIALIGNVGGEAKTKNVVTSNAFDTENGKTAGTGVKGYVDYTFMLKAIGRTAADSIVMDKCELTYGGNDEMPGIRAFRAAMFVLNLTNNADDDMTTVNAQTADATTGTIVDEPGGSKVTILKDESAEYFDETKAVNAAGDFTSDTQTSKRSNVAGLNTAAIVQSAGASAAKDEYYRVVIRVWLEGEDKKCNVSDFLNLTKDFALDVHFSMGSSVSAVNKLTTVSNLTTITISALASGDGSTTVVNGTTYYKTTTNYTVGDTTYYFYTTDDSLDTNSPIYTIIDNDVTNVTNRATVTIYGG